MFNAIQIFRQTLLLQPINAVPLNQASFKITSRRRVRINVITCGLPMETRSIDGQFDLHSALFLPQYATIQSFFLFAK